MPQIDSFAVAKDRNDLLEIVAIGGPGPDDQEFTEGIWLNQQLIGPEDDYTNFDLKWRSLGEPGHQLSGISMVRGPDGGLEVVVVADGLVMHASKSASDGTWSGWETPGNPVNAGPEFPVALAHNQDGRLEVFAVSGFKPEIWHSTQQPGHGPWNGWRSLGVFPGQGATVHRAPAIARNKDGRLEVYVAVGTEIWHTCQASANSDHWTPWSSLGGPDADRPVGWPTVVADQDGRLQLFATSDRAVWSRRQPAPGLGPWEGWTMLHGESEDAGEPVLAAGTQQDGRLVVFALRTPRGGVEGLQKLEQIADEAWTSAYPLTPDDTLLGTPVAPTLDNPVLVADYLGRLRLFCRIPGSRGIFSLTQAQPNGRTWVEAFHQPAAP
jgi:hypothetical protein